MWEVGVVCRNMGSWGYGRSRASGSRGCGSMGVQFYSIDTVLGVILDLEMSFDRPVAKTLTASFYHFTM